MNENAIWIIVGLMCALEAYWNISLFRPLYSWLPFFDYGSVFDSFHLAKGTQIMLPIWTMIYLAYGDIISLQKYILVCAITWFVYYQLFNLFFHVLFMKREHWWK